MHHLVVFLILTVPAGWPVLSRWWAARVGPDTYALTLHWRPIAPHLAHGVINKYQVSDRLFTPTHWYDSHTTKSFF